MFSGEHEMCKGKRYRVWDEHVITVASGMDVISMGAVKASLKATLPLSVRPSLLSRDIY
jgi:hypothetical protein